MQNNFVLEGRKNQQWKNPGCQIFSTIRHRYVVEDCFTPWLIHDEGEFIFIFFKEFFFFFFYFKEFILKKNP